MYRILLFNDSKWRDLPGTVFLKLKLQELLPVAIVEICSFHLWKSAIELFNPHLVVLNHIQGKRNKMIANHVKRHGGLVVVQFSEGIIDFEGRVNVFKKQEGHKDVDLFLCWNDIVSELVDGITVGCPRFDIYQEPYSKLIDSKALFCDKHGLNSSKPIVVFGDSWPGAKFSYSMKKFHKADWNDLNNVLADRWDSADAFAQNQYGQQELFKFIIKHTAIELGSDVQVIASSHPMSDFNRWQTWGRNNNIYVIEREYVFNTLNAADVYISKLGSMSISEAWLLDTKTIPLGQAQDSAFALEQYEANLYTTIEWNDNFIPVADMIADALYPSEDLIDLKQEKNAHISKWGFNFTDATGVSAREIFDLLEEHQPLVSKGSYSDFSLARVEHDRIYQNKLDGFGNWDKAITQMDVDTWASMIGLFAIDG